MATSKRPMDMLTLEGKELDEMYRKYLASYGNKQKTLKQDYGVKMWLERYSKEEFKAQYEANARTMMLEKGWTKINDKVVIRNVIERQATELTEAQAKAFQKGMREQGKFMTLAEIHQNGAEQIAQMYDELIENGVTDSHQRRKLISAAFFGSPL